MSAVVLLLSINFVSAIILNCPLTQEPSTHAICKILKNTNIDEILNTHNFSDDNYCFWNFVNPQVYINCSFNSSISDIVIDEADINGTLDLTVPWPSTMKQINFEQTWSSSMDLYGEWNWTSFENMDYLNTLVLNRNQFYGPITGSVFDLLSSKPLTRLNIGGNNFSIDFTDISNSNFFFADMDNIYMTDNIVYGTLNTSINGFFSKFPKARNIEFAGKHSQGIISTIDGYFENFDCISSDNLPELIFFDIPYNNFSGSLILSPNYVFSSKLVTFEIHHNKFNGAIDWNIFSHLYKLQELDITHNEFTGIIDFNIISDLVVNGSLIIIELNDNRFEQYVDFSWIPHTIHNSFILAIDSNVYCDPQIYPCLNSTIPINRTLQICYNRTHCESSCQCSTNPINIYTSNTPSNSPLSTSITPSNAPTNSPITCLDFQYLNSIYNSNDGIDIIIKETLNSKQYNYNNISFSDNLIIDEYIANETTDFFKQTICNKANVDVCFVGCFAKSACFNSIIQP
eukprot:229115_1